MQFIPGIGVIAEEYREDFHDRDRTSDGAWRVGVEGVLRILTPLDRKVEFICFEDRTLTLVKSGMGHPAIYPLPDGRFEPPAKAVLMDLDGTSVVSEEF
ncbi:MAG TPA: HAD family phosphatase, partial [bacterium]|nr:HAD family phosphatase [bacterium]